MSSAEKSSIKSVVTVVVLGTICWVGAGVVALAADASSKVIWTCVVGALLGVTGIRYSVRRNRRTGI
jgi:uncharacterized membrane protein HdeD (DUF308 family)